ncbi:helix-turn-helix domain-containing protein [Yersinia enterocolitica]|uniref:helix-turn-helix domain-containing protein n=1 Tax=Yersinia enterocolitica TaxID=630 RepID=UPI0028645C05|nr:helix-turn-helix domain-containing protein [Yersinia enterocolitica]HDV7145541.1 helix-turn-helix domain-containing protein [Yersinia enterocolitica]HDV7164812.1 helix-turn-helix domain-containing protein [Yersinia enterocolitica]
MKNDIGLRLREERERLGLSQVAMGDIGGVKKLTQLKYEKGESCPDASYLALLAKFGLDVQYVVIGERSVSALTADESEMLDSYRSAPVAVKAAALAALVAGNSASEASKISISSGSSHRIAGRDYHEHKK